MASSSQAPAFQEVNGAARQQECNTDAQITRFTETSAGAAEYPKLIPDIPTITPVVHFDIGDYLLKQREMDFRSVEIQREREIEMAKCIGRLEQENKMLKEFASAKPSENPTPAKKPEWVQEEGASHKKPLMSASEVATQACEEEKDVVTLLDSGLMKRFGLKKVPCQFHFSRVKGRAGVCKYLSTHFAMMNDPYYNRRKPYLICPKHAAQRTISDIKMGSRKWNYQDSMHEGASEAEKYALRAFEYVFKRQGDRVEEEPASSSDDENNEDKDDEDVDNVHDDDVNEENVDSEENADEDADVDKAKEDPGHDDAPDNAEEPAEDLVTGNGSEKAKSRKRKSH